MQIKKPTFFSKTEKKRRNLKNKKPPCRVVFVLWSSTDFVARTPSAYRKEGGVWGGNLCGFPCSRAATFARQKCSSKKEETHERVSLLFGAAGRIRTADLILTNYRKAIAACCWLLCLFACIPLFPMVAGFFLLCLAVFYYSLKVLGFWCPCRFCCGF